MIEQQIKQFNALDEWFQSSLGLSVADEFRKQLSPVLDYLTGDTLLQLGNCANNSWLADLKFTQKWIASPFPIDKKNVLLCTLNQLPLQRDSFDCVIAPLAMEPFDNCYDLIDEIDRIIKPMGYVVFLCLNPWSLWGGAMKCGLLHCYADNKFKMHTPLHLNRIFMQRGYRQCSLNNFYYIPPVKSQSLLKKLIFFNEIGKMLWPFPSGFYCYIAQKYEEVDPSLEVLNLIKEYNSPLQAINNYLFKRDC